MRRSIRTCLATAALSAVPMLFSVAAAQAQSTARPLKVVQLGDSYSAGNGAGDYWGPKDCYRSSSNWAERYLDTLRSAYNVTFVNRACSGGVLSDLTSRREMDDEARAGVHAWGRREGRPGRSRGARRDRRVRRRATATTRAMTSSLSPRSPESRSGTTVLFACTRHMDAQIDAVGRDTDVVLLTIGGNDVHFSEIIKQCFVIGVRDPGDCRDNIEAAQAGIGDVGVRTASFLRTLKARMRPDAHIVLAAYPHLEKDPGFELRGGFLFLDVYPVGREIRELGDLGDDSQRRAADAVNAEGGAHVTLRRRGQAALRRPRAGRSRVLPQRRPLDPRVRHHHPDGVVPLQLDRPRGAREPARAAAGDRAGDARRRRRRCGRHRVRDRHHRLDVLVHRVGQDGRGPARQRRLGTYERRPLRARGLPRLPRPDR